MSSTDASYMNKSRQKHTQPNKNISNPQDQQEFAPKEREKSADAKDHTKHQQPARGNEHPSPQQGPDKSTEKEDHPNLLTKQPLNLYRSEAKVPLHTSKHGSTQQSSAESSVSGNYQQKRHANADGSPSTANKQYKNLPADNKSQQNQHTAGSYQQNQPSFGNLLKQPATDNYQLNQPATGNHQQNQPNSSFNETIQNQRSSQPFSGSNQQVAQKSSVIDQGVSQQQPVIFNTQTYMVQYPSHLIPTAEEYNMYISYNNYYRSSVAARHFLGAQIYDKCRTYLAWLQSIQYNF